MIKIVIKKVLKETYQGPAIVRFTPLEHYPLEYLQRLRDNRIMPVCKDFEPIKEEVQVKVLKP